MFKAEIAIILGSGLGGFENELEIEKEVSYNDIDGYPVSKVAGHKGRIFQGKVSGKDVLVFSGRFHLYEGISLKDVVRNIDTAHKAGCKTLIVTNAAGGIKDGPGTLVSITDQINLTGTNPFLGGHTFYDMSEIYNKELVEVAQSIETELTLSKGIYAGMLGPNYESPAEVNMVENMGGTLVGMSTVHEAMYANSLGMSIIGFSMVTNWAAGKSKDHLNHDEVKEVGNQNSPKFKAYLKKLIEKL
jgi:purine-nucleoside phosphorylase